MVSHPLRFSHPVVGTLELATGLDEASWGYSLNTMTYATYGGEVVQILSCQIDNLNLSGTFRTYKEMEKFYTYMLRYMQVASQGRGSKKPGKTSFNQEAMKFLYPERGWEFEIMPIQVPGFRRGTEVVAPTWQMIAHVIDKSGDVEKLSDLVISEAEIQGVVGQSGEFSDSFGLEGKVGYDPDNPFSDPYTKVGLSFDEKAKAADIANLAGEAYAGLIKSYMNKDFDGILGGASKPALSAKDAALTAAADQAVTNVAAIAGNVGAAITNQVTKSVKATKRKSR